MNILLLTSDYLPDPLWGMGWHVSQLREVLHKNDQNVYVATANKSSDFHENIITTLHDDDEKYLSDNPYEIFNNYNKFNIWQKELTRSVLDTNVTFDVLHCHNWMSWLTTKALKEKFPDAVTVVTFHFLQKQYELMVENPIPTYHQEIIDIESEAIQTVDRIVALSQKQKDFITKRYDLKDEHKISIIPHSINFDVPDILHLKAIKSKNKNVEILFVGRIEYNKGIIEILEVFSDIKGMYPDIKLNVAGDGPLIDELKQRFSDDRIVFYGFLPREDLEELFLKANIFCLPSSGEVLPLTVIEAMFFGAVPIFSKGETLPRIFEENKHGLLIRLLKEGDHLIADKVDLKNKLIYLLENRSLLNELMINTVQFANENYSKETMVKMLMDVYMSR